MDLLEGHELEARVVAVLIAQSEDELVVLDDGLAHDDDVRNVLVTARGKRGLRAVAWLGAVGGWGMIVVRERLCRACARRRTLQMGTSGNQWQSVPVSRSHRAWSRRRTVTSRRASRWRRAVNERDRGGALRMRGTAEGRCDRARLCRATWSRGWAAGGGVVPGRGRSVVTNSCGDQLFGGHAIGDRWRSVGVVFASDHRPVH